MVKKIKTTLLLLDIPTEVWCMQSSRLHFIGTWRNRYRKRFPMPSAGLNKEISNNSSDVSRNSVIIHVDMVSYMYWDSGNTLLLSNFLFIFWLDMLFNFILMIYIYYYLTLKVDCCFIPTFDFVQCL